MKHLLIFLPLLFVTVTAVAGKGPKPITTMDTLNKKIEDVNKLKGRKKALHLKALLQEFLASHNTFKDDKAAAIKKLKRTAYLTRMELAHNKATDTTTGNLDKELGDLIDKIEKLNKNQ